MRRKGWVATLAPKNRREESLKRKILEKYIVAQNATNAVYSMCGLEKTFSNVNSDNVTSRCVVKDWIDFNGIIFLLLNKNVK